MKVDFFRHNIGKNEKKAVLKALGAKFLTLSGETLRFEEAFCGYMGSSFSVALSSCTAGLHLSLIALGIKKADEVITTPLTFVATANAILQAQAKPVFADVDIKTGLLNLDAVERKINRRTKAIIPVHLYGTMCDMRALKKLARKYNLAIIEDAAHCIEGKRNGIRPGELSDCACFSFYATKNITCGEGGAVITNNKKLARLIYKLRLHGISRNSYERFLLGDKKWDMNMLGWKYTMPDILSCLLIPQLKRIEFLWKKRKEICDLYRKGLSQVKAIQMLETPSGTKSANHLFTILVDERDKVIASLKNKGIGLEINYKPVHLLNFYKKTFGFKRGDFKNAEYIGERTISLPLYPLLKKSQAQFTVDSLVKLLSGRKFP